jgi:hypothetical protein
VTPAVNVRRAAQMDAAETATSALRPHALATPILERAPP